MAAEIPQDIMTSVAVSNVKAIAEQPAILSNLSLSNQIFAQQRSMSQALETDNAMSIARLGTLKSIVEWDPSQSQTDVAAAAKATTQTLTGDVVSESIARLLTALNSGGVAAKTMINVPPVGTAPTPLPA